MDGWALFASCGGVFEELCNRCWAEGDGRVHTVHFGHRHGHAQPSAWGEQLYLRRVAGCGQDSADGEGVVLHAASLMHLNGSSTCTQSSIQKGA